MWLLGYKLIEKVRGSLGKMDKKSNIFFKSFLWQLFILFCVAVFSVGIVLLVQSNKTNRFKDGYFVVINAPTGYSDKGFTEASILGACLFLGIDKEEDCDRSNPKFAEKLAYGYPNTINDPKRIYDYVLEEHNKSGAKTFILPGFTYTEFIGNYIYDLEKKGITIVAIDTFFETPEGKNWPKNLYQYGFKQQYSGFNAGLYAGLAALVDPTRFKDGNDQKDGQQIHFAALGGLEIPPIAAYALGFKHGIELVNEFKQEIYNRGRAAKIIKAEYKIDAVELKFVALDIIGGFDSQLKSAETKTLARDLFRNDGVSVLFSIAVSLTEPMHKAAFEENFREGRKQNYVVGVDVDQGYSFYNETTWQPHEESLYLTSALIDLKELINKVLVRVANDQTETGSVFVGASKPEDKFQDIQQSKLVQIPLRYRTTENPVWQLFEETMKGTNPLAKDGVPLVEMPDENAITTLHLSSFLPFPPFQGRGPAVYRFISSGKTVEEFKEKVNWFQSS